MLYEFRMYHTAEGRVEDSARRLTLMPPLFRKHGIPDPLGHWIATAGDDLPVYAWMLRWPDSAVRAAAFASLYGDPAWVDVRDSTNAGREIMRHYNLVFLQETPAHEAARQLHAGDPQESAGRVHEVRILDTLPGRAGHVMKSLVETDLAAMQRAGARTLGLFDILSGFPGPSLLQFLSWPDANSRDAGHAAFAADPHVREKVSREIADKGNPYYRVSRTWQFRPTSFGVPAKAFDGPAVA